MPILDIQKTLRRLGKIRMGEQRQSANGRSFPAKLENWRLTSPSYELLDVAAGIYGGDVQEWKGAPTEGRQFELYTDADRLKVIVPPGDYAFSQWYELWTAGGCQRRCDGHVEQLADQPCQCPDDQEQRAKEAAKGRACKMTTRLSVILPDIPDVGTWMLESHGYYAAVELAGAEEILRMAAGEGRMIPAQLRIDQRTAKRDGETRRYAVPVLELTSVTAQMLMTGEVPPSLGAPTRAAIGRGSPSPPSPPADLPTPVSSQQAASELPPLPHELEEPPPAEPGEAGVPSPRDIVNQARKAFAAAYDAAPHGDKGKTLDRLRYALTWAVAPRVASSKELDDDQRRRVFQRLREIEDGQVTYEHDHTGVTFTVGGADGKRARVDWATFETDQDEEGAA